MVAINSDIPEPVLARYNLNGPRYTSYPTAAHFYPLTLGAYRQALSQRNVEVQTSHKDLSVYVHIPFCNTLCYYCACNRIGTRHKERSVRYIRTLKREIRSRAADMQSTDCIKQLHFGGGTPTFLTIQEISEIVDAIGQEFSLTDENSRDYSIEIDPRTVDEQYIASLATIGFNRVSFGVQDYTPEVQKAINRVQCSEHITNLTNAAKASGIESINYDLIYGLPKQSEEGLLKTIQTVIDQCPTRVALFSYAHLPDRFPIQRRINPADLPSFQDKARLQRISTETFASSRYDAIGLDHFALPTDSFAIAKRNGTLQRNFQGFTTHRGLESVGFGISAISDIAGCLVQNDTSLRGYENLVTETGFAGIRGFIRSGDDQIRASVIESLLCYSSVKFDDINQLHQVDFEHYFKKELRSLSPMINDGLLEIDNNGIYLTTMGLPLARIAAMQFDSHLGTEDNKKRQRFSQVI